MGVNKAPRKGERIEKASRYVEKCEKMLDLGCGEGFISFFVKNRVTYLYGVDKSVRALKKAKNKKMIVKKIDLDEDKIPFKDNFFDFITCLDVIEHIRDPIKVVKEAYRVLKNRGKFIISAPNIRFSNHLITLAFRGYFPTTSEDKGAYDGGHIHYFTFSDLKKILMKSGFRVVREEGIINKGRRGIKGRIVEKILGKKIMNEFRSGGILIVAQKI